MGCFPDRFKSLCALLLVATSCLPITWGFHIRSPFTARKLQTTQQAHQLSPQAMDIQEQMFYDYDKPIMLIGSSGQGNELVRLASSFLYRHGSSPTDEHIVAVRSDSSESDLIKLIDEGNLRWPQVILLDFLDQGNGDDHRTMEGIARSLYSKGLLSIYVNVDSDSKRKAELEKNVFVDLSDYEICIKDESQEGDERWEHIAWEFERLLARARLVPAIPGDTYNRTTNTAHLTMGQHTFFLSLSFPNISQVEPFVKEMCLDVDAMEYRADLLECRDSRFEIIYGMQLLRRYCRPHCVRVPALPFETVVLEDVMPIVYTVRTRNQAGTYPDDEAGIDKMFEMLRWGLRAGVEVLDVESAWDKDKIDNLLARARIRYSSQILGSEHVVGRTVSTEEAVGLFQQCALDGRAHGAKVVLSAEKEEQDRMAYEAASIASSLATARGQPVIPNIALVLGDIGKFSRVINLPFTPVTHESLPMKAAPGQMTSAEIMTTRLLTKIFSPKKYCILGHNITYSVSPQMQGAAFAATKLPHEYIRADVETVNEFVDSGFFKSGDFGGASVTIPHKQAIISHVDVLSEAAEQIGSVNTLIAREEYTGEGFQRVIYGDNTDWRGIYNPLHRLLGDMNTGSDFALIVGAGGTARAAAYVALKLGLRPIYFNRTPSKAEDLARTFGGVIINTLDEVSSGPGDTALGDILEANLDSKVSVVISTLPASAGFVLPVWLLRQKPTLPVVFDVNYKPYDTKLLLQAESSGCRVVRGCEMLWEQGAGQFELWTQRTAPYRVMKQVVLNNCIET